MENRWNNASNPPSSMREVIVCTDKRRVLLGHYNYSRKEWFEHGSYEKINVIGWQEKPLPLPTAQQGKGTDHAK